MPQLVMLMKSVHLISHETTQDVAPLHLMLLRFLRHYVH